MMNASDIRALFFRAFRASGHTEVASSPLIPAGDPTLLFTNAGMVQFKSLFLGTEQRGYRRAVSAQKCLRAGGKHNDLDNVGRTARHHTFFEMLGNFSFGDYFKPDAIALAWSFLTRDLPLSTDRLWATVYKNDDEAEAIWKQRLPADRIVRLGEKDNFWQMGETGPCGPCSEILIDQGPTFHPDCPGIGRCNCDRYLEIWNLVFMQYNRGLDGALTPLPAPSIDTGMGLERLTAICQGVASNYETDLFSPLFSTLADQSGRGVDEVRASVAGRVIVDHLRALTFLAADGVIPSNEGRGYVFRRILRRAARFGKKLGQETPFLHTLTRSVVEKMGDAYPELVRQADTAARIILNEETRFAQTLHQGTSRMDEVIRSARRQGETRLSGDAVFLLYDTYGFPVDLAEEMAQEEGLSIDLPQFQIAMEGQRERARRSWVGAETISPIYADFRRALGPTDFTGYDVEEGEVILLAILKEGRPVESAGVGERVELLFDRTPFYGEGGGQIGDRGRVFSDGTSPDTLATIDDTVKPVSDLHLHRATVAHGTLVVRQRYRAAVDTAARRNAARNHTATHLLHALLAETLGDHVKQSGSSVAPDRLRFDFRHFAPLTEAELNRIETRLNEQVHAGLNVRTDVMGIGEAIGAGALALFGEKYGDRVRVVKIADVSMELCGGTHCRDTAEIGLFSISREGGVAAGIRRIEAVTGPAAYQRLKTQERTLQDAAGRLKSSPDDLLQKIERLTAQMKAAEQEITRLHEAATRQAPLDVQQVGPLRLVVQTLLPCDLKGLREQADRLRNQLKSGVVVVGAPSQDRLAATMVAMVTADWTARISAADLVREAAPQMDGSGGGSAKMAQAGGKNPAGLQTALDQAVESIKRKLASG
jgi:alanyl-tRNA synthetase